MEIMKIKILTENNNKIKIIIKGKLRKKKSPQKRIVAT